MRGSTTKKCIACSAIIGVASKKCKVCGAAQPYKTLKWKRIEKTKQRIRKAPHGPKANAAKIVDTAHVHLLNLQAAGYFPILLLGKKTGSKVKAELLTLSDNASPEEQMANKAIKSTFEDFLNVHFNRTTTTSPATPTSSSSVPPVSPQPFPYEHCIDTLLPLAKEAASYAAPLESDAGLTECQVPVCSAADGSSRQPNIAQDWLALSQKAKSSREKGQKHLLPPGEKGSEKRKRCWDQPPSSTSSVELQDKFDSIERDNSALINKINNLEEEVEKLKVRLADCKPNCEVPAETEKLESSIEPLPKKNSICLEDQVPFQALSSPIISYKISDRLSDDVPCLLDPKFTDQFDPGDNALLYSMDPYNDEKDMSMEVPKSNTEEENNVPQDNLYLYEPTFLDITDFESCFDPPNEIMATDNNSDGKIFGVPNVNAEKSDGD